MVWTEKLIGTVVKGLPTLIKLMPEWRKKNVAARLNDYNLFASLGANDDLLRVLRIAWIQAALEVNKSVLTACKSFEGDGQTTVIETFSDLFKAKLIELRAVTFDRGKNLEGSLIDDHFELVLLNAPTTQVGKGSESADPLTRDFGKIAAAIVGCQASDVPALYTQIAAAGIFTRLSTVQQTFGDLVFLVFVETIQAPNKYPEAGKAFQMTVSSLGVKLGRQCLKTLEGIDERVDQMLDRLDDLPSAGGLQTWLEDVETGCVQRLESISAEVREVGSKVDMGISVASEQSAQTQEALAQILEALKLQHTGGGIPASDEAILALAKPLFPDLLLNRSQAYKELEFAVSVLEEIRATGTTAHYRDRLVNDTMAGLRESIEAGELAQGAVAIEEALASLDKQEADTRESIKRQRAELLDASIKQHTLLRDPQRVAEDVVKLISLDNPNAPVLSEAFMKETDAYFKKGEAHGSNFPLEVAVELSRKWVDQSADDQALGEALLWLGKSLAVLGERAPHDSLLRQAEGVFRRAVKISSASRTATYANAQNGLAGVLLALGARHRSADFLHEAVDRFNTPLQFFSEVGDVATVAIIKSNLGAALRLSGQRDGGVARLRQAVSYLQEALLEPALSRRPQEWGTAQSNLGNALRVLGEREHNIPLLQQSVQAFRSALLERMQSSSLNWGITQNDLANTLLALGEHTDDLDFFHQAAEAYNAALTKISREQVPLEWANTHHNLANLYYQLAMRDGDSEWLTKALAAAMAALEERTRQLVPLAWARTLNTQANALRELGDRNDDPRLIEHAIGAYKNSLEEHTRERLPRDWAMIKHNLGNAFVTLASFGSSNENLNYAIKAYQDALLVRTSDSDPVSWARTTVCLGDTFFDLAESSGAMRYMELALENYREALPHLTSSMQGRVQTMIAKGESMLAEYSSSAD
ncbi:tetratricopeptide repeat protein [Pseudomonas sichuanensis]|uniref:tetratricopeptide repeat protein n=1 Tax=Pseudomonas sichuanensis TaxID=2213015 RepID=UPI002449F240|nr:tetratricopeptide repeat protein [Pseudomonas sichuanensis]MDH0733226.1 tetratricopeptide repeat protein [Pseudomonas sichuanensis]MDH1585100.1 tetratricopeptide repeat protein [Pseudomonas sichuanensis]MDH1594527.1 tetratricopeptide repeat protein [Pseudomonas sichuanensis]MDH1600221.1 tetratricopeptide repeat protein [Pseudomonas sichuanensis]